MKKFFFLLALQASLFLSFTANAATIEVGSGQEATANGWIGDQYIVYGTLKLTGDAQFGPLLTVMPGGTVIATGNLYLNGANIHAGSTITVAGNFGTYTGITNIAGSVNVGNLFSIDGNSSVILACPANIITKDFNPYAANLLSGTGYVEVTNNFTSWQSLTTSPTIVLNASGANPSNDSGNGKKSGNATLGTSSSCPPPTSLPVEFGAVKAVISNNILQVNWSSVTETNNDHFVIEASKDGKQFKEIGTVTSKASDGNSEAAISYSFNIGYKGAAALVAAGAFALMFGFKQRSKYAKLTSIIACITIVFSFYACSKNDADVYTSDNAKLYIRILQVDKNGNSQPSKVVIAEKK